MVQAPEALRGLEDFEWVPRIVFPSSDEPFEYLLTSEANQEAQMTPLQSDLAPRRLPGACKRCKRLKMKCEFEEDHGPCKRCLTSELSCEVEPRVPTSNHTTRHNLMVQLRERDKLLAELLRHINTGSSASPPLSPLANSPDPGHRTPDRDVTRPPAMVSQEPGYPAPSFSESSEHTSRGVQPHMTRELPLDLGVEVLASGVILPQEVDLLFKLFFDYVNPCISLLNPAVHTPRAVLGRSRLLFSAVCAVAARHLVPADERRQPGAVHRAALECTRREAAAALIGARKSVEMVQGYILLAEYSPVAQSWAEDRTCLFKGLALRLAADLDLHQAPAQDTNGAHAWLIAAALDGGVPEPPLHRTNLDAFLRAELDLLRISSRFREVLLASSKSHSVDGEDTLGIVKVFEDALTTFWEEWEPRIASSTHESAEGTETSKALYRTARLQMLQSYSRLAMYTHCLHTSFLVASRQPTLLPAVAQSIFETAIGTINWTISQLAPTGFLRFAPASHLAPSMQAAFVLLRMIQDPRTAAGFKHELDTVIQSVAQLARTFELAAEDEQHAPSIYSGLLNGLLSQGRQSAGQTSASIFFDDRSHTASVSVPGVGFDIEFGSFEAPGGIRCWC